MQKAFFFDRDGVLIENRSDYVKSWEEVEIFPFAIDALKEVEKAGYLSIVVTNQAIVAKGGMTYDHVEKLNTRIVSTFIENGARITAAYFCPHVDADDCDCRKPKPGMLLRAAKEFEVDLNRSIMIGDAISDMRAGEAAGTACTMVRTGRGVAQEEEMLATFGERWPVADNVLEAVMSILSEVKD